eukprot:scaffold55515_cov26-Tisochrysis_lutea.AAC.4
MQPGWPAEGSRGPARRRREGRPLRGASESRREGERESRREGKGAGGSGRGREGGAGRGV